MALQGRDRYYLYSANFAWKTLQAKATHDIAFTGPALLPLLSTETLECLSAGANLSRRDKIERIADRAAQNFPGLVRGHWHLE